MKLCKRCFKEFDEDKSMDHSPASDLGDIFVSTTRDMNVADICLECREELGVMNIMGFRP